MKLKKPLIKHYGDVGVDSGQLLIIDPLILLGIVPDKSL